MRYKHTTARQVDGDDGYCWAVFVHGEERINGLTRPEASYYRGQFEKEEEGKLAEVEALIPENEEMTHQTVAEDLGRYIEEEQGGESEGSESQRVDFSGQQSVWVETYSGKVYMRGYLSPRLYQKVTRRVNKKWGKGTVDMTDVHSRS